MGSRFADRLVGETYSEDVLCQIRLDPDPRDEGRGRQEAWISERLLARLRFLGLAYELPLLSRVPQNGSTTYPEIQISPLDDELSFLCELITDPALLHAVRSLGDLLRIARHEPRGWSLTIEGRRGSGRRLPGRSWFSRT